MLSRPDFNTRTVDRDPAAHAEMNYERFAGVEIRQDVLRAAPQSFHSSAGQAICKVIGKGDAQVAASRFNISKPAALDGGSKATFHGFDFG